jgi:hypothetical protein
MGKLVSNNTGIVYKYIKSSKEINKYLISKINKFEKYTTIINYGEPNNIVYNRPIAKV